MGGRRRAAAFLAAALAVAVAAGGCGPRGVRVSRRAVVAVQAPLSGPRAPLGLEVLRGAELVVAAAAPAWRARGWELALAPWDEADPRQGVANAHLLAADPAVLGAVGFLDSDVALPFSELVAPAGWPLLAVAVTAPEFTARGLENVFRLLPPDDGQGRAAARFAVERLRARAPFVVHDRTAYGQELADAFAAEAARLGARVRAYRGLVPGSTLAAVAEEVRAAGTDLVFYAGDEEEGARLVRALRQAGVQAAFLGGDSLDGPGFAALAGPAARGVYYASLLPALADLPAAAGWAAAYRQRYGSDPGGLALLSYDATRALLAAAAAAGVGSAGGRPPGAAVAARLRGGSFPGLGGPIAFDARGENTGAARAPRFLRLEGGYPGVPVPSPPAGVPAPAPGAAGAGSASPR